MTDIMDISIFPTEKILKCDKCLREMIVNINNEEGLERYNNFKMRHNKYEPTIDCSGNVKPKKEKKRKDKDKNKEKENGRNSVSINISGEEQWTFDKIIGNDEAKLSFKRYLLKYKAYGIKSKGIILHGRKGTGKSILLKALANDPEYKEFCNFVFLQTHNLTSSSMGESSMLIDGAFNHAYSLYAETGKITVIILDDAENVFHDRSDKSAKSVIERTNALLSHIDGIYDRGGVFIILTTNRVEDIDDAILDRFDELIEVEIEEKNLVIFLKRSLSVLDFNGDGNLDGIDFNAFLPEVIKYKYNGRDFRRLTKEASFWYNENKKNGDKIMQSDIENILYITSKKVQQRRELENKKLLKQYSDHRHNKSYVDGDILNINFEYPSEEDMIEYLLVHSEDKFKPDWAHFKYNWEKKGCSGNQLQNYLKPSYRKCKERCDKL